jgi:hypothetical protein
MSRQRRRQLSRSAPALEVRFGSGYGGLQGSRIILVVPDPIGRGPCIALSANSVWVLHAMAASGALFAKCEHRSR